MIDRKIYFIFGAVALVLIVAVLVILSTGGKNGPETPGGAATTTPVSQSDTYKPVDANTVVPDANSQVDSGVAKPTEVKAVGAGGIVDQRNFQVVVKNDSVSPQKVIVYVGNLVNVAFTSADKQYDFVQPENGMSWTVSKEKPITLTFQSPNPGQFTFYCVSCGGPDKGPVGYFVVVPK